MVWNRAHEKEVQGLPEREVDFPRYRSGAGSATALQSFYAHKFRPLLYFDENEHWRPLDVDRMLSEPGHQACTPAVCSPLTSLATLGSYPTTPAWLDTAGAGEEAAYHSPDPACNVDPLRDCDGGISAIYYDSSKVSAASYRYFNYWFFYRFNDAPDVADPPAGQDLDHEGDWENVAVAVDDRLGANAATFAYVNCGQHGHHYNYLRENLSCDAPDGDDSPCGSTAERVHAYPAEGTHATYPDICTGLTIVCGQNGPHPENQHGGERRWSRNETASSLLRLPAETPAGTAWPDGPRPWTDWPGRWGASGTYGDGSPASPANQSTFDQPWDARCAEDNASDACVASARVRRPRRAHVAIAASARRCRAWFGPSVRATVCSPRQLRRALAKRRLDRQGEVRLRLVRASGTTRRSRGGRRHGATAPGLAQLVGRPLHPGDRIIVSGRMTRDTVLLLRAANHSNLVEVTFRAAMLRGKRTVIRVTRAMVRASSRGGPRVVASSGARHVAPIRSRVQGLVP